ncbi:protein of unknown function (plasmid) [Cupriavidus taiwanensis]|uniref:Uncharacterized protein n=1 Tax=Cupriavidus taiwanensis TaxID=164546 RepID=A0A375I7X9_9BURK|nr:hypothetical protein CT19425_U230012 [Cupriavidus taiwanensis]SPK70160.1 hypothetical protein CT19425_U380014 [Cupriavidus taiwanensis]SPK77710.1 protein of unknown function [Cupriavidus taiwanensis]
MELAAEQRRAERAQGRNTSRNARARAEPGVEFVPYRAANTTGNPHLVSLAMLMFEHHPLWISGNPYYKLKKIR